MKTFDWRALNNWNKLNGSGLELCYNDLHTFKRYNLNIVYNKSLAAPPLTNFAGNSHPHTISMMCKCEPSLLLERVTQSTSPSASLKILFTKQSTLRASTHNINLQMKWCAIYYISNNFPSVNVDLKGVACRGNRFTCELGTPARVHVMLKRW